MKKSVIVILLLVMILLTGCDLLNNLTPTTRQAATAETPDKGISVQPIGSVTNQDRNPVMLTENFPYSYGAVIRNYDLNPLLVTVRLSDGTDDAYGGLTEYGESTLFSDVMIDTGEEVTVGPTKFIYHQRSQSVTTFPVPVFQTFATYDYRLETGDAIKIPTLPEHCTSGRENPERENICDVRIQPTAGNNNVAPIRVEDISANFIPEDGTVSATVSLRLQNVGGGYIPDYTLNPIVVNVAIDGFAPFTCIPEEIYLKDLSADVQCTSYADSLKAGRAEPKVLTIAADYRYEIATGQLTGEIIKTEE